MTEARYPASCIDLLRHGDCADGDILRGRTDSPLAGEGFRQMEAALLDHAGWDRVVTSPLARCHAFAADFAERRALPLSVIDELRELDFGDWEGLSPQSLDEQYPELAADYYRAPTEVTPPGGESLAAAQQRLSAVWTRLLSQHSGEHLLVVTHGGVIRLLLAQALEAPLASSRFFAVARGGLSRLRIYHSPEGDFPQLVLHQGEASPC